MGYTHHWEFNSPSKEMMKEAINIINQMIMDDDNTILCGDCDTEKPVVITEDLVVFNGKGDEGHESFYIALVPKQWDFCKTARKEYDKFVVASLAILKSVLGKGIRVSSEGDEEDWQAGLAIADRYIDAKKVELFLGEE